MVEKFLIHQFVNGSSLFKYAVDKMKLTPDRAYAYIRVARRAAEFPLLQKAIDSREVSVSKACKMVSVMTAETEAKWVEMAKKSTKEEIERAVAEVSPRAAKGERKKRLSKDLAELSYPITDEALKKFERVRNLLSQAKKRNVSFEEATESICDFYLKHHDPVQKAERAAARKEKKENSLRKKTKEPQEASRTNGRDGDLRAENMNQVDSEPDSSVTPPQVCHQVARPTRPEPKTRERRYPAVTRHQVNLRDRGRCQEQVGENEICGEERFLDFHHLVEVSRGGSDTPENLITLCRYHPQLRH